MNKKSQISRNTDASKKPSQEAANIEQDKLNKMWDETAEIFDDAPVITQQETEDALKKVHVKFEQFDDTGKAEPDNRNIKTYLRLLAAAVVLFGILFGYLLMPKYVSVPFGETAYLTLPDGSEIHLNSGSEIRYSRFFGTISRKINLEGEAFFSVVPHDLLFSVHANGSVTEVTGTSFNLRSWSNDPGRQTLVTLESGEVVFYSEKEPENPVRLSAGQSAKWNMQMSAPTLVEKGAEMYPIAWMNRNLSFTNQPLTVIFNEIERKFNIKIEFDAAAEAGDTLTTFYSQPESAEDILTDICMVKGLNLTRTANGFRISR